MGFFCILENNKDTYGNIGNAFKLSCAKIYLQNEVIRMTARKAVPPQPLNELLSDTVDLNREYTDMPFDNEAQEVIETSRQIAKYWGKKKAKITPCFPFFPSL